jgi:hypothetical protein
MTKLTINTLLLVALFINTKAIAVSCSSLTQLNWLIGQWQTDENTDFTNEVWRKVSDKTFEGQGKTNNSSESLRLVKMSNEIFYLAKVSHNPVPIAFKLTHCKNKWFVFENMLHDFPNRIEYRQVNSDTLQVIVSGKSEKPFTIQLYRAQNKASVIKNKTKSTWL